MEHDAQDSIEGNPGISTPKFECQISRKETHPIQKSFNLLSVKKDVEGKKVFVQEIVPTTGGQIEGMIVEPDLMFVQTSSSTTIFDSYIPTTSGRPVYQFCDKPVKVKDKAVQVNFRSKHHNKGIQCSVKCVDRSISPVRTMSKNVCTSTDPQKFNVDEVYSESDDDAEILPAYYISSREYNTRTSSRSSDNLSSEPDNHFVGLKKQVLTTTTPKVVKKNFMAGSDRLKEEANPDSMNQEPLDSMTDIDTTYIKQEESYLNFPYSGIKIKVEPGLTEDVFQDHVSNDDAKDFPVGCSRLQEEPGPDSMDQEEHLDSMIDVDIKSYIKQED